MEALCCQAHKACQGLARYSFNSVSFSEYDAQAHTLFLFLNTATIQDIRILCALHLPGEMRGCTFLCRKLRYPYKTLTRIFLSVSLERRSTSFLRRATVGDSMMPGARRLARGQAGPSTPSSSAASCPSRSGPSISTSSSRFLQSP